jgi:hypothetical protein
MNGKIPSVSYTKPKDMSENTTTVHNVIYLYLFLVYLITMPVVHD